MARALSERERAIEQRATELLEQAIQEDAPWLRQLGQPPEPTAMRATWLRQARVVAAYRELWDVRTPEPIDDMASTIEQRGHQKRAAAAATPSAAARRTGTREPRATAADRRRRRAADARG